MGRYLLLLFFPGVLPLVLALPPAVYWHTSPVPLRGTALFSGSFGASPVVSVCTDGTACASPRQLTPALAYNGSVAFTVPDECVTSPPTGGCVYNFCDGAECSTSGDVNSPEVWFALAHPPLAGTSFVPGPIFGGGGGSTLVNAGADSVLRVVGRSLAFARAPSGALDCVPATARGDAASTTLQLAPGSPLLAATNATCWEATFGGLGDAIAAAGGGPFPLAVLRTQFGSSALPLVVAPLPPPAALTVIDVDSDAAGDVAAALALAAATLGGKRVVLGARTYALSEPLNVSSNTVLEGAGAALSTLTFTLSGQYGALWGIAGAGSDWGLRALGITILAAPPDTPAIWMRANTSNLTVTEISVELQQTNVSNALRIEGAGWVVADSDLEQAGVCFWPPTSEKTPFQPSVTLYTHGATDGYFHRNTLRWQCAAFDMDVSSRVVFEDNVLECTQRGVIPHGNSISFYDWAHFPTSQSFLYAHNTQSRPANNNKTDWAFHESLTTDGPGGWGAGVLGGVDGVVITVPSGLTDYLQATGTTALVIAGPGAGQWRGVISRPNATAVELASPFDGHVVVGKSVVGVVATVGGKVIVGNRFIWGSVVQEFGTTVTGVFADNSFDHQNNAFADSGAVDGSLTGFGLCYGNEPQPMFYVEYSRNNMTASNGISLHDVNNPQCASTWPGPYIRWAAIRGNAIGGVAPSNPGVCGSVNASNPGTSDLVVEGNTFSCPPTALLPCNDGVCVAATHSIVQ